MFTPAMCNHQEEPFGSHLPGAFPVMTAAEVTLKLEGTVTWDPEKNLSSNT